jgi:type II secretory pathway component PulM
MTALSLSHLPVTIQQSLRDNIWAIAMELFEQQQYAGALAWLQRYAKRMTVDVTETDVRTRRAMALVAMQVRD